MKFKHVMLLAGYEFKNKTVDEVKQYLKDNNIYHTPDANIYENDDTVMY